MKSPEPKGDGEPDAFSGRHTRKATFDMDVTLHKRLKIRAAQEGRGMIELVEDALRKYLSDS